jgi:hypothetical protein
MAASSGGVLGGVVALDEVAEVEADSALCEALELELVSSDGGFGGPFVASVAAAEVISVGSEVVMSSTMEASLAFHGTITLSLTASSAAETHTSKLSQLDHQ